MTYAQLLAAIRAWTNSAEVEQSAPTFVTLAEADLDRRLGEAGVAASEARTTLTLTAGQEYGTQPTDLSRLIGGVLVSTGEPVESVTPAALAAMRTADPQRAGKPDSMTLAGGGLRFFPTPNAAYGLALTYQRRLSALSDANASNWLIAAHPDAYLYGALARAAEFIGDDAAGQRFGGLFERAVAGLIAAERARGGCQRAAGYRADLPLGLRPVATTPDL